MARDCATYDLRPHTDLPSKLVSIILYVRSDPGERLGTMLHCPIEPGFACAGFDYHDPLRFREAGVVPLKPNSAYIFVRDDMTFHGVTFEPADLQCFARITLQSNIWIVDPLQKLQPRQG